MGALFLPPAQGSESHNQAWTANAFCPSLTFPLPAGLGWDEGARRPLILLLDPGATPSGSPGNSLQGTGTVSEEQACNALSCCCCCCRTKSSHSLT